MIAHLLDSTFKTTKYEKLAGVKYEEETALDLIKKEPDAYVISSMMLTVESVYSLLNSLTQSIDSQREILLTGCGMLGLSYFLSNTSRNFSYLKMLFALDVLQATVSFSVKCYVL